MIPPAINIRQLQVHAGRRLVLDVSNLRIETGSVVALMGPNGAGKTTLLRTCLGLARLSRGEVRVLGLSVSALRWGGLAGLRRRIGFVPQLIPTRGEMPLTVREVVAIGRTARAGLFHPFAGTDWRVVDEWIERLGLGSLSGRAFGEISGGEQRKTLIARAMAQEPELLLLDEPTANLDLGWRERMVETIERLHRETRLSLLLVCHELEVLPPSCRQVELLDGGRIAASGAPEAVFTSERIQNLYGAALRVVHQGGRHAVLPLGAGTVEGKEGAGWT